MIIKNRMKGQGYLFNDNRPSGNGLFEADVFCCPHCQAVLQKENSSQETLDHWCPKCFAPICVSCSAKMVTEGCTPFREKIDKAIEEHYRRKQLSRMLGLEG